MKEGETRRRPGGDQAQSEATDEVVDSGSGASNARADAPKRDGKGQRLRLQEESKKSESSKKWTEAEAFVPPSKPMMYRPKTTQPSASEGAGSSETGGALGATGASEPGQIDSSATAASQAS